MALAVEYRPLGFVVQQSSRMGHEHWVKMRALPAYSGWSLGEYRPRILHGFWKVVLKMWVTDSLLLRENSDYIQAIGLSRQIPTGRGHVCRFM